MAFFGSSWLNDEYNEPSRHEGKDILKTHNTGTMTIPIYSKVTPGLLLHMIVKQDEPKPGRVDLCPPEQFIQAATLRLKKGTTFRAHRHNWHKIEEDRVTQEIWIVISGVVRVYHYDTDGALLSTENITEGEMAISFSGGHNYEILTHGSYVVEVKGGPYKGQEWDKTFL